MNILAAFSDPVLFGSIFSGLIVFGLSFYFWQSRNDANARIEVRKRLDINRKKSNAKAAVATNVVKKVATKTNKYYSATDPNKMHKMRLQMVQAGYMQKSAIGYFLASRMLAAALGLLIAIGAALLIYPDMAMQNKLIIGMLFVIVGYFIPNVVISRKIAARQDVSRAGFPDVMDLMIVAAEAGLTTEASIERISKELQKTYPVLSEQLHIVSIEIRAGKQLDEALRGFGERVGLEEVQGFATMIQQSKELGTSIADALRVYSEEMRFRRMMYAEEKAYALPAKLSVPVTLFILPIVIGVAIIPTIVRLNM